MGCKPLLPSMSITTLATPVPYVNVVDTARPRLIELLKALHDRKLDREYQLCSKLAKLPPAVRLAVNLKDVLSALCSKDIENVLVDGVSEEQRLVLLSIDTKLPVSCRKTTHALLDMHARMQLVRMLGSLFKLLRCQKTNMLEENETHG